MNSAFAFAAALAVAWAGGVQGARAEAAAPWGVATILEGDAGIVRAASQWRAVEGMKLQRGDLLETGAATFAQIELPGVLALELGPASHLLFDPPAATGRADPWLYLMDGWAKLDGRPARNVPAGAIALRSPLVELPLGPAVVVLHETPAGVELFVESGEVKLVERQARGRDVAVALRAGSFYTRKPGARGSVAAKGVPAFATEMPRAFHDSLPSRLERFRDRDVQPRDARDVAYVDVARWLKAEPSVRRPLMPRWRAKAHEPAFRAALIANLSAHPEWDPILFPEKYKPKEPRPAAALAAARAASAASAPY